MRLIDADALKYKQQVMYKKDDSDEVWAEWFTTATEIANAPTIDPVGAWIPCDERLPDKNCDVLVTFIPSAGNLWAKVIIANYSDLMGTINYRIFWIGNYGKNDFVNITDQVSAWMPLPKPYAERKDNGQE